jgi:hypothetical protein
MSFLDDAISSIGKNLAQTAMNTLSDATGLDVGGTLGFLFGDNQPQGGHELSALIEKLPEAFTGPGSSPEDLARLEDGLRQQGQMLTDIGNTLTSVSAALASITGQIENLEQLLQSVGQEQLYLEWQAVDNQLVNYLAGIDTAFKTYADYISDYANTKTTLVEELTTDILDTNVGPQVGINAISTHITGGDQAKGVLQLWSDMVQALVLGEALDYREAVKQYQNYYKRLVYAQLRATTLVMEAYNYQGTPNQAETAWATYRKLLIAQEQPFIAGLLPLVCAGVAASWYPNPDGVNYRMALIGAVLQINPALQTLLTTTASSGQTDFYAPSSIFLNAEKLLANLYLTDPTDRRIVVYMTYANDPEISTVVSSAKLTLSPESGADLSPVSEEDFGPFTIIGPKNSLIDRNFLNGGPFFRRFVFTGSDAGPLADGTYFLTNLNGQDGLVPLKTAASGPIPLPFMNPNIYNYPLAINGVAQPFDFMNFVCYMLPQV